MVGRDSGPTQGRTLPRRPATGEPGQVFVNTWILVTQRRLCGGMPSTSTHPDECASGHPAPTISLYKKTISLYKKWTQRRWKLIIRCSETRTIMKLRPRLLSIDDSAHALFIPFKMLDDDISQ
jgi:hypothetical protein